MKSSLAAVKRQRFPAQASRQVCRLFILVLATQLVILPPHIPCEGQEGGMLLLHYSMICVSGLATKYFDRQNVENFCPSFT